MVGLIMVIPSKILELAFEVIVLFRKEIFNFRIIVRLVLTNAVSWR